MLKYSILFCIMVENEINGMNIFFFTFIYFYFLFLGVMVDSTFYTDVIY